jgi:hypothetical protein
MKMDSEKNVHHEWNFFGLKNKKSKKERIAIGRSITI